MTRHVICHHICPYRQYNQLDFCNTHILIYVLWVVFTTDFGDGDDTLSYRLVHHFGSSFCLEGFI